MMDKKNIRQFIKELRKGNLKDAKNSLEAALIEKFEDRKSKINTEN